MSLPIGQAINQARRALDSGRVLFRENLVPECDAHFAEALAILVAAWARNPRGDRTVGDEPSDQDQAALAALDRAGYPGIDRLRAVLKRLAGAPTGAAEREQTTTEERRSDFDSTWAEIERLYRFTVWRLDPPFQRPRVRRLAGVAGGLALVLAVLVGWRLWGRPVATASAVYSSQRAAANAIDGVESTEWLLPDGATGWLQINFPSPRVLRGVRLLNAHNPHYQDRGSEQVRLIAYCEHHVAAAVEGRFAGIVAGRSPMDFSLDVVCATHLRIEVLSYFKMGGGLAEVELR